MTVPLAHNKDNNNNNYTHHSLLPQLVARSVTIRCRNLLVTSIVWKKKGLG